MCPLRHKRLDQNESHLSICRGRGLIVVVGLLVTRLDLQRGHRVRRPNEPGSALGRLGDRVPLAFRLQDRYAALAARREACVSAAPAPFAARKEAAVNIPATMTTLADTNVTTAVIACRTRELVAMGVAALPPSRSGEKLSSCGVGGFILQVFLFGLLIAGLSLQCGHR